jgi:hypothetical protein
VDLYINKTPISGISLILGKKKKLKARFQKSLENMSAFLKRDLLSSSSETMRGEPAGTMISPEENSR